MNRISRTAVLIVAIVMVAGCATTTDPWTGEPRATRTSQGAAVGAGIGAVLGAISGGDRLKRVAIGAGVGALTGAAVGSYMDRNEQELRRQLAGSGVSVTRNGDDVILNMPSHVTFDFDSASLKPEFLDVLDSVALVVQEFDQTVLVIDGHTDSTGSRSYNLRLSEQRSDSVGRYLASSGVAPARFATYGYGPDYPVSSNDTSQGRAMNRRVELTLIPVTQ